MIDAKVHALLGQQPVETNGHFNQSGRSFDLMSFEHTLSPMTDYFGLDQNRDFL